MCRLKHSANKRGRIHQLQLSGLLCRPTSHQQQGSQTAGIQLLDLGTLTALRNDESVIRWGLARLARYQKLSDELIVPNLDQEISFFYDPATKKLRKQFEIYPEALETTVKFADELERTHTELLKQIQAERQRNH